MQQGDFVADVAYFYGEGSPLVALADLGRLHDAPTRYAFDFVNAQTMHELFRVRDRHLVTPSGMRYRALQLGGDSDRMTLATLRRIHGLVRAGIVVIGNSPSGSPSLADYRESVLFQQLKEDLWEESGRGRAFGRGRVFGRVAVDDALESIGIAPDFVYSSPKAEAKIMFLHRRLQKAHVYFLFNPKDREEIIDASFRVTGRAPELWHADTGSRDFVSYRIEGGRTIVPLRFRPHDAFFVVFRKPTRTAAWRASDPVIETLR